MKTYSYVSCPVFSFCLTNYWPFWTVKVHAIFLEIDVNWHNLIIYLCYTSTKSELKLSVQVKIVLFNFKAVIHQHTCRMHNFEDKKILSKKHRELYMYLFASARFFMFCTIQTKIGGNTLRGKTGNIQNDIYHCIWDELTRCGEKQAKSFKMSKKILENA